MQNISDINSVGSSVLLYLQYKSLGGLDPQGSQRESAITDVLTTSPPTRSALLTQAARFEPTLFRGMRQLLTKYTVGSF
jgi:hypothetical protein